MILLQIIHEIRKLVHIPLTAENEIYSFVIILEKHNYFVYFVYIVWCDFMGNFKNENTEGLFCNMR